jgi:DNA polymerase III subunit epsilon
MTNQIDFFVAARASSIQWAKDILAIPADQLLILDTETTGLDNTAEIVQLSIIDGAGDVVINTFVHPTRPIPPEATAIHHITNQDVAVAPKWETVFTLLQKIVEGKTLVIYNKDYDLRLIKQSSIAAGISFPVIGCKDVQCAMQAYSEFVGEWNDYRGSFRWQKLTGGDHSALGDCRATLDLIRKMADADHIEVADVTYPDWPQESASPLTTSTQAPAPKNPAQTRVESREGNTADPIVAKLDALAEYKAQRELIDLHKWELLDSVKVPAEIIAAQEAANKARQAADSYYLSAQNGINDAMNAVLDDIVKPELPAEYLEAMAAYQAEVDAARSQAQANTERWQKQTLEKKAFIDATLQEQTAQVYAALAARKNEIEAEFGEKAAAVDANIAKLRAEIIAATIEHGSTVKGKVFQAIFVKGRTTWNTDKLDGMAEIFPSIKTARTVGNPSVTIR